MKGLFLAAVAVGLLGCAATDTGTSQITPDEYHFYQSYLKKPGYKAFVKARNLAGEGKLSVVAVWGAPDPQIAIDRAMEKCRSQTTDIRHGPCGLHSIGNVNASRLSDEEVSRAVAVYRRKFDFTLADLEPDQFEGLGTQEQ